MRHITKITAGALASVLLFAGCTAAGTDTTTTGQTATSQVATGQAGSSGATTTSATTTTVEASPAADVDWSGLPTTEVTLTDDGLAITEAGTYVLTGSTTGQVTVDTDGAVRIVLDNATIASAEGAAIQVDSAELTVIELADGTTNTVSDAATRLIWVPTTSSVDIVVTGCDCAAGRSCSCTGAACPVGANWVVVATTVVVAVALPTVAGPSDAVACDGARNAIVWPSSEAIEIPVPCSSIASASRGFISPLTGLVRTLAIAPPGATICSPACRPNSGKTERSSAA